MHNHDINNVRIIVHVCQDHCFFSVCGPLFNLLWQSMRTKIYCKAKATNRYQAYLPSFLWQTSNQIN